MKILPGLWIILAFAVVSGQDPIWSLWTVVSASSCSHTCEVGVKLVKYTRICMRISPHSKCPGDKMKYEAKPCYQNIPCDAIPMENLTKVARHTNEKVFPRVALEKNPNKCNKNKDYMISISLLFLALAVIMLFLSTLYIYSLRGKAKKKSGKDLKTNTELDLESGANKEPQTILKPASKLNKKQIKRKSYDLQGIDNKAFVIDTYAEEIAKNAEKPSPKPKPNPKPKGKSPAKTIPKGKKKIVTNKPGKPE